jgi:hypothetical protein
MYVCMRGEQARYTVGCKDIVGVCVCMHVCMNVTEKGAEMSSKSTHVVCVYIYIYICTFRYTYKQKLSA